MNDARPAPEGSAATPLGRALAARVAAQGPLGVDAFMQACLLDPEHGYYATRPSLGADFTTAPEVSQIFGELIGLALAQAWLDQGRPRPATLLELGPGRGVLMADALRACAKAPGFLEAARLHLLEASARLRAEQAARLASAAPVWLERIADGPDAPIFAIANELFDALPVRQWRREGGRWRARVVTYDAARDAFAFALAPPAPERDPPADAAARAASLPEGAWLEHAPGAEALLEPLSARIARDGGAALIVDYGYDAAERHAAGGRDTLQAIRARRAAHPLAHPGEADLTALVSFDDLAAIARRAGCDVCGPIGQGPWLRRLGAEARAAALARARPELAERIALGLHRLTHPNEMGARFRAIALVAPAAPAPAGFEDAARRPAGPAEETAR